MTDCCEYKSEQGRDCPVRKQRIEVAIERNRVDTDPYVETIGSIKELFFVIFVTAAVTLLAFIIWVK